MAYLGNTPTSQSFIAGTDYFNGNGSTVNFTLSRIVNSVNDIEVSINNVEQIPNSYSVSGATLTISVAPSVGTNNVYVRYLSTTNVSLAIPSGTSATFNKLAYNGTLTGGTDVVDIGSGQMYKDASGNLGVGTNSPSAKAHIVKSGAEVARFTNSQSNGGDWEFKIGGGGFENRKFMLTDKYSGTDNVRLSLDSSGYVIIPNQPAFKAGRTTSYAATGSSNLIFNQTDANSHFNIGNHYNSANGVFTAPISGRYFFTSEVIFQDIPNGTDMTDIFHLTVNNVNATYSFRRSIYSSGSTGLSGYFTDHANIILNLSAGDAVAVRVQRAYTVHGNTNYTWFAGYLLG